MKEPGGARREDLFDTRERAVLRFATLLTAHPGGVEPRDLDDLDPYFSEEEVVELVAVIATANWTNRFNDGLQTPLG